MNDLDKIKKIAEDLKSALYKADKSKLTEGFEEFPNGSCGNSSDILAYFLMKNGFENIKYVCGEKGKQSHAWLEIKDIIIDITIQQFDESITNVIFPKNSLMHKKFKIEQSYIIKKPEGYALMNVPYLKTLM